MPTFRILLVFFNNVNNFVQFCFWTAYCLIFFFVGRKTFSLILVDYETEVSSNKNGLPIFSDGLITLSFKISTDIGLVEKRRGSGTWENLNMKRILGRKEVSKERLFVTPVKCEDEPTLSLLDFRLKKADKP
jgi:hypothetical protein